MARHSQHFVRSDVTSQFEITQLRGSSYNKTRNKLWPNGKNKLDHARIVTVRKNDGGGVECNISSLHGKLFRIHQI